MPTPAALLWSNQPPCEIHVSLSGLKPVIYSPPPVFAGGGSDSKDGWRNVCSKFGPTSATLVAQIVGVPSELRLWFCWPSAARPGPRAALQKLPHSRVVGNRSGV